MHPHAHIVKRGHKLSAAPCTHTICLRVHVYKDELFCVVSGLTTAYPEVDVIKKVITGAINYIY